MKNKFLLLLSVMLLLSFLSCTEDHISDNEDRVEVNVSASFIDLNGHVKSMTRATDTTWVKNDSIGLFMKNSDSDLFKPALADNKKYTADGTGLFLAVLENKIYFPIRLANVDFISYYPYTNSLDGFNYNVDLSNQNNQSDLVLMYSNNVTSVNSSDPNIKLEFEHQLAKIILKIESNHTGKKLSGLTAKITNVNNKASFSLVDGKLTSDGLLSGISFNVNIDGTLAQAIILPENDLTNKSLVLSLDGANYVYNLSNSNKVKSFEKSKQYKFTITLQPNQGPTLEGVIAVINPWILVEDDIEIVEEPSGTNPPDTAPTETPPVEGNGTKDNPYNITQAKILVAEKATERIWVKGYIVGAYTSNSYAEGFTNVPSQASNISVALAFSKSETDPDMCLPVNFIHNKLHYQIGNRFNLKENATNLGKEVIIMGDINFFYGQKGPIGLINNLKATIDGIDYPK